MHPIPGGAYGGTDEFGGTSTSDLLRTTTKEKEPMRQLIVTEFMTLEGVVEAPGGEPTHPHAGWTMAYGTPDLYEYKLRETLDAESLLLGRTTYEGFAAAWPERDGEFADKMNSMPKHVVTGRLDPLGWNATRLAVAPAGADLETAVGELKAGDGGPILVAGSATLVRSLLAGGLVDELRLMVYPVLVGGGLRIFPDDRDRVPLELTDLVRYDTGVLLQTYRPAA
jgi:dihydrofolate reductase